MPTNWNALYLGINQIVDPTEGNTTAENAGVLVGTTFGGPNDKLFDEQVFVTTINVGGSPGQLEQNNAVAGDQLQFNLGAGTVTTTFDAVVQYNATITYNDGSTWTGEVNIAQDSLGNTFLVPNTSNNAAQQALIAKPIHSLTLNSVITSNNGGLAANRQTTNFLACFTGQTRILTPTGARPVDDLRLGDLVMTHDHGPQPVRWIGQTVTLGQGAHAPIRFAAGAMGNDHALRVSPQHCLLLSDWRADLLFGEDEVLVPAKFLVGRPGVSVDPCAEVTYFHLLFDRHEIINAEGVWSESFYPGAQLVLGNPEAQGEIAALLASADRIQTDYGPSARRILKAAEAAALLSTPDKGGQPAASAPAALG